MQQLPKARTADLLEQETGNELLIYDLQIDKAYNLNKTSKLVYRACANQMSFDELKRAADFTDDLIHFALDQLRNNSLIEDYERNHFAGMNRRELVKRVALSTMIALPVIAALSAPIAASAASTSCTPGQDSDSSSANRGQGGPCICGQSNQNNSGYQLCNTTSGGLPQASGLGCKQGCVCRSDFQNCQRDGRCQGICG